MERGGGDRILLRPCAYLHNLKNAGALTSEFYKIYTSEAPLFARADTERLQELLRRYMICDIALAEGAEITEHALSSQHLCHGPTSGRGLETAPTVGMRDRLSLRRKASGTEMVQRISQGVPHVITVNRPGAGD